MTMQVTIIKRELEISFRDIKSQSELEDIKSLYLTAFPSAERREYSGLIQQLNNVECNLNLIIADQIIAGFIITWDFKEFVFAEHFAVKSEYRGLGIGEGTLTLIKENFNKPIVLETELSLDEISSRRIKFYQLNGFHLLKRRYFQPSYDGIKPEVELKLMSTEAYISSEKLDEFIRQIRLKVYHAFS
jgi:ribosomal protein S18 acetylase RimI-like enzyme